MHRCSAASSLACSVARWVALARSLFTEYLLPFEFAAVILTVAVVAAVMLTLRRRTGLKTQNPTEQTMVKGRDRLRVVKMASETPVVHTNTKPSSNEEAAP